MADFNKSFECVEIVEHLYLPQNSKSKSIEIIQFHSKFNAINRSDNMLGVSDRNKMFGMEVI